MGNALAVYEKINDPIVAAKAMALPVAAICGGSEHQGFVIALTCMMEGMTPIEFLAKYHLIQGKPSVKADWMLGEFVRQGGSFSILESSPNRAAASFTWKERTYEREFTWEQAQQSRWPWKDPRDHSKGFKDNWSTPSDRESMLWVRLVSASVKRIAPEVFSGAYTPEEMEDVAETPSSTVSIDAVKKPKKTAKEVAAEAAAKATAAPEPEGEVIDASFEVVAEETTPPWQEEPVAEAPANKLTPNSVGSVEPQQLAKIHELFAELECDEETKQGALERRNVKRFEDLTFNQAKEMIAKMEEHLAGNA
jgi:hypothetical protein